MNGFITAEEQMMMQQQEMMAQMSMGAMDMGYPKLTKGQVLENMQLFVFNNTGITVSKIEKIDEIPQELRHACAQLGICKLPQYMYQYPTNQGVVSVPFFFCSSCGKMYYCTDYIQ